LLLRLDGIEPRESKTDEAIIGGILNKLGRHSGGKLYSLFRSRSTTNIDCICTNNARSA
jgi:hypothetical protein